MVQVLHEPLLLVRWKFLHQLEEVGFESCGGEVVVCRNEAEFVVEVVKVLLLGDSHGHLVRTCDARFNPDTKGGQGTAKGRGFAVFYIGGLVNHAGGAVFMGVARCSDAAIGIPNHSLDAAAVGLQVNEVGFNGPTSEGWLVAEIEQALVDFNIVLAFDVGGFEFVHGLGV